MSVINRERKWCEGTSWKKTYMNREIEVNWESSLIWVSHKLEMAKNLGVYMLIEIFGPLNV